MMSMTKQKDLFLKMNEAKTTILMTRQSPPLREKVEEDTRSKQNM